MQPGAVKEGAAERDVLPGTGRSRRPRGKAPDRRGREGGTARSGSGEGERGDQSLREVAEESRPTPVPTPVREAAGAPPLPGGAALPERKLTIQGATWTIRTLGQGMTGLPPNAGAPLLLLGFVPEDARAGPAREVVAIGRSLEDFATDELTELFHRSAPAEDGTRERAVDGGRERDARPRR